MKTLLSCSTFLFFYLTGCVTSGPTLEQAMNTLDKQGHRGCRGLLPENTVAAMKKAVDLGVTTLEMDVVITKDGDVVLSHEPFFNHEISTGPDGNFVKEKEEKTLNIYQMSYDQVKTFDVGLKPHPRFPQQQKMRAIKPRLSELIDTIKSYCSEKGIALPQFNIETKTQAATDNVFHPTPEVFVTKLMAVINNKKMESGVIIQSFDFRTLQYLHQHYPSVKTAMLIEEDDKRTIDEQLTALGFTPSIYSPHYSLLNKERVKWCHQKNMKVIPWTVNEIGEIKKLIQLGADGIITDYPDLFTALNH